MQWHCYHFLHRYNVSSFFKYMPNLSHKNLKVLYVTRIRFLNSLSVHYPNNKCFINPDIRSWFYMILSLCPILSYIKLKIATFSHSSWKTLLECPQHASQTCTNTYIILKVKQCSSSSPSLQPCLLKFKVNTSKKKKWGQDKIIEAKRMVKVDFFFELPFLCAY